VNPPAKKPWNDWFHLIAHVYGSWLRGDPRGWRAVHHRQHVEGDYKNPTPKGKYDGLYRHSISLMKRDAVSIAQDLRAIVVEAVVEKLRADRIEVLVASVDGKHLHVLGRCRDHKPRSWLGRAKKHTSHSLRQMGLRVEEGGLWARRSWAHPIGDREHQVNTFHYIAGHEQKRAAVWRFDRKKAPRS
jgi:REP element-mobilizing transposase RayT